MPGLIFAVSPPASIYSFLSSVVYVCNKVKSALAAIAAWLIQISSPKSLITLFSVGEAVRVKQEKEGVPSYVRTSEVARASSLVVLAHI